MERRDILKAPHCGSSIFWESEINGFQILLFCFIKVGREKIRLSKNQILNFIYLEKALFALV